MKTMRKNPMAFLMTLGYATVQFTVERVGKLGAQRWALENACKVPLNFGFSLLVFEYIKKYYMSYVHILLALSHHKTMPQGTVATLCMF